MIAGAILLVLSLFADNTTMSALLGITGFSSLWSILELIHQEERVKKGWFPANPDKKKAKEEQSN